MSELTTEEGDALVDWWDSDWPDTAAGALGSLAEVVEAILAARLADQAARLAAVEALVEGGDLPHGVRRALNRALHPQDPDHERTSG